MYSDARLTMRLPGRDLSFVKEYARENGTTLTKLFLDFIQELRASVVSREAYPESVREVIGIIPQGEGDSLEDYHDYILEKYS